MILAGRERPNRVSPDAVAGVSVPTLVMQGEKDVVVPPGVGRRLGELIPDARLILYPEAGHVPMEQIPDRSAADARAFIESLQTLKSSGK
jgi:pimeloyl-ACP methyl ester carboxylesterase